MSPRFSCITPEVRELPISRSASWCNLVCVECLLMINPIVLFFLFYMRLMLLLVVPLGFKNTGTVTGK